MPSDSRRVSETIETPQLRRALERAVELGERTVQVAAYLGDELIASAQIGDPRPELVFPSFSVSKAEVALAVHVQAERGLIDYDAPIARYWPEYGTRGKDRVTVRHVLTHRGGVPHLPADIDAAKLDWDGVVSALAGLEPLFEPGTTNSYHSLSFGWLLGEVVRRTDPKGRPFARFVEEELCEPLGIDAFWFGIPEAEAPRVARLAFPGEPPAPPPDALVSQTVPPQLALVPEIFNQRQIQQSVIPAAGGIGNARSVARFFALLANGGALDGVRLLSEARVRSFLEPYPGMGEPDLVYNYPCPIGMGGLWLDASLLVPDGGMGHVLSHIGAGCSIGMADLLNRLAIAVCHDRMFAAVPENPFAAIGEAIREIAAARR